MSKIRHRLIPEVNFCTGEAISHVAIREYPQPTKRKHKTQKENKKPILMVF